MSGDEVCRFQVVTRSEEETEEWGRRLAALLRPGDCLLLVGELGAGKTCLVRGVARGLGIDERITSPTFILLREHRGRIPLYHLDAYRLEGPEDLFMLGVEELAEGEGVLAVEWGDRVRGFFRGDFLEIEMRTLGDSERELVFVPHGRSWRDRLEGLSSPFRVKAGGEGEREVD